MKVVNIVAVTEFDGVIALLTYLCIYFQLIFFKSFPLLINVTKHIN